jgi:membrane-anchored glycerophosphoryl diester phosphodiesterase (GDPDase)
MMVVYLIFWIVSLIAAIVITRLVFEIPKFSKKADAISETSNESLELLKKQNELLTLLVHAAYQNKKIALINKTTSGVKTIDVSELKNHTLGLYDIEVLSK